MRLGNSLSPNPTSYPYLKLTNSLVLETTAKLHHETIFPSDITRTQAIAALHDHEVLIKMDPHLVSYTSLPSSPSTPETKIYKVLDKMEQIPKALWSQDVHSDLQYTNLPNGIRTNVKAPLGLVMDTHLIVEERPGGQLVITEDVEIKCSRLMMPVVKGQCEANWKDIHKRFIEMVKKKQEGLQNEEEGEKVDAVPLEMATPILAQI